MASYPIAATGILGPQELKILFYIFDVVSGYHWFCKSQDSRERFAAYILRTYLRGIHDPFELEMNCASAALARFSSASYSASRPD